MLFTEAGNMLYFKTQEELVEFAKEVNAKQMNEICNIKQINMH